MQESHWLWGKSHCYYSLRSWDNAILPTFFGSKNLDMERKGSVTLNTRRMWKLFLCSWYLYEKSVRPLRFINSCSPSYSPYCSHSFWLPVATTALAGRKNWLLFYPSHFHSTFLSHPLEGSFFFPFYSCWNLLSGVYTGLILGVFRLLLWRESSGCSSPLFLRLE